MGSVSAWHWLVVLLVVAMIFGTGKLRDIGTDVGAAVKAFKDGARQPDASEPATTIGAR